MTYRLTLRNFILAIVVLTFFYRLVEFAPSVRVSITNFLNNQGNYDSIRKGWSSWKIALDSAEVIPETATVETTWKRWQYPRVVFRYVMYPREFSDEADYLVHIKGKFLDSGSWWVAEGATVYPRKGLDLVKTPKPRNYYSLVRLFFVSFGVLVANILIGFLFCVALKVPVKEGSLWWFIGISYLLGFFLLAAGPWAALIFGFSLSVSMILFVWLGIGFALLLCSRDRFDFVRKEFQQYRESRLNQAQSGKNDWALQFCCMTISLIYLSVTLSPAVDWDGIWTWLLKSKVLFYKGIFDFSYTAINFYPILWPMEIALQYVLRGAAYDAFISWTTGLVLFATLFSFLGALNFLGVKREQRFLALMFYAGFFFGPKIYLMTAENLFIAYTFGLLSCALAWLNDQNKKYYLYLSLLMGCALSLTKFEGFVTSAAVGLAIVLVQWKKVSWKESLSTILKFSSPVILTGSWYVYMKYTQPTNVQSHFQNFFTWNKLFVWSLMVGEAMKQVEVSYIILLVVVVLSLILVKRPWNAKEKFLFYVFLLLGIFSFIAHLGWPVHKLQAQLDHSAYRVFLHAMPPLALWWASLMLTNNHDFKVED